HPLKKTEPCNEGGPLSLGSESKTWTSTRGITAQPSHPQPKGGSHTGEVKNEPTYYNEKVKRAAHMLFFKRGRVPGARSWELKTGLGKGLTKVMEQLDEGRTDVDIEERNAEEQAMSESSARP